MLKNSRSPSTFSKHQRENESLAVYFWLDNDKQQFLTTELQHDLVDANMEIDCSHLEASAARHLSEKNVLQNAKNQPLILQNSNFTNSADGLLPICKFFLSQSVPHLTQLCRALQASVNSHE